VQYIGGLVDHGREPFSRRHGTRLSELLWRPTDWLQIFPDLEVFN
jgi:hypothetical protein